MKTNRVSLLELFGLSEIDSEEQGYSGAVHPHLEKMRGDIEKTATWIAQGLQRIQDPDADHLIPILRNLSKLPSEQIMPSIMRMQTVIFKIGKNMRKDGNAHAQDIKDVQTAFPALMKFGAQMGKANSTDKHLWQTKMKGRWDDEEGFIPLKQVTSPTGAPDFEKGVTPITRSTSSRIPPSAQAAKPPMKSVSPIIRRKPVVPGPVKPKKVGESILPTMVEVFNIR